MGDSLLLMSRGLRLARFFRAAAEALSQDHRVTVLVKDSEMPLWQNVRGITVLDFDELVRDEKRRATCGILRQATKIEEELGLTVFQAASNYILYSKFYKRITGKPVTTHFADSAEKAVSHYVASYSVLRRILDTCEPLLLFFETPDMIECRVALALMARENRFALGFGYSPFFEGKIFLTYGTECRNILQDLYYQRRFLLTERSYCAADDLVRRIFSGYNAPFYIRRKLRRIQAGGRQPLLCRAEGVVRAAVAACRMGPARSLRHLASRMWLDRVFPRAIPDSPYVAVFLQYQPEASTSSQCPRYANQEYVVEQLAIHAPASMSILVREHPLSLGMRGKEYFGEMKDLPNVVFCHPAVNAHEVIRKASAVVTITGSAGLEAALMDKHVGVLGRPFYTTYRAVRKLDYPEDIFRHLKDPSWQPGADPGDKRVFVASFIQSLYDFGYNEEAVLPVEANDRLATPIRDFIRLQKEYGLRPSDAV